MSPEFGWWGGMWLFPVLMPLVMLVCFGIVIYLFSGRGFFRAPWQDSYRSGQHDTESALDILKKRYARGEINQGEFERMKKDIV